MIFPTGTVFEFSPEDFEEALLRIGEIKFEPEDGVFEIELLLMCGIFGQYLVDRAPGVIINAALNYTLEERGLPLELADNVRLAINANALRMEFKASIDSYDGKELIAHEELTENTDYKFLSARCVEISPTGVIKLGADPSRVAEAALSLLPKRYHWMSIEDGYEKYLKRTEAGFSLNLDTIDYETLLEGDDQNDDSLNPMDYVVLSSKLRIWQQ